MFHTCSIPAGHRAGGSAISVHRYETADGSRWQVRWREANGRVRTRSLTSKSDAKAFDADVKARRFKGEALPRPARETLAAAYDEWWRLLGSQLSSNTQRTYTAVWNAHVRNRFDHHRLSALVSEPQLFAELMADMRARGVGNAAQRKVFVVISSVLSAAVEWRKIDTNPVWRMRKPPGTRERIPRPFPPLVIERIRIRMLRRTTKDPTDARAIGDATLVTLMSYAGLRPGEALALTWRDIGERTIAADKAVSDGQEARTKTGAVRSVPLLQPLSRDLLLLCTAQGSPGDEHLVLPAAGGGYWSRSEFNNWRNRVWKPVVQALAGEDTDFLHLATARPYDCRGSFVSLHLRAGASPLEVAAWAGHSPQIMFRHYANVIEELVGKPTVPAEEQIAPARDVVEALAKDELDEMMAAAFRRPALSTLDDSGAADVA